MTFGGIEIHDDRPEPRTDPKAAAWLNALVRGEDSAAPEEGQDDAPADAPVTFSDRVRAAFERQAQPSKRFVVRGER
jgi:hypothetical protein